ncbi:MAG TPA: hypothetical protein VF407_12385, partial [Polyangiaceae bacterium]
NALKMAGSRSLFAIGIVFALTLGIASCTDDLSVGSDETDAGVLTGDGSIGDGGTSSDGAITGDGSIASDAGPSGDSGGGGGGKEAGPIEDGGCGVVIAQEGDVVAIQVMADSPPFQTGGTLVAGTYALTAYRVHGAGPKGTGNVRETLVLTGSNVVGAIARLNELSETTGDFTAHGPQGEHDTFSGATGSPAIFVDEDCPDDTSSRSFEFTTSGTALTLFEDSTSTERVYTRVR